MHAFDDRLAGERLDDFQSGGETHDRGRPLNRHTVEKICGTSMNN